MAKAGVAMNAAAQKMWVMALGLAGVETGIACEGTAVESRTAKVNGKAFLFMGKGVARLKLEAALGEAAELARTKPACYQAGSGGWVKITYEPGSVSGPHLVRWVKESYGLMGGGAKTKAPKTAKKRASR